MISFIVFLKQGQYQIKVFTVLKVFILNCSSSELICCKLPSGCVGPFYSSQMLWISKTYTLYPDSYILSAFSPASLRNVLEVGWHNTAVRKQLSADLPCLCLHRHQALPHPHHVNCVCLFFYWTNALSLSLATDLAFYLGLAYQPNNAWASMSIYLKVTLVIADCCTS